MRATVARGRTRGRSAPVAVAASLSKPRRRGSRPHARVDGPQPPDRVQSRGRRRALTSARPVWRARRARARARRRTARRHRSPQSARGGTAGTSTIRSMRSRSGPDSRPAVSRDLLPACSGRPGADAPRSRTGTGSSRRPAGTGQGSATVRARARNRRRRRPRAADAAPRARARSNSGISSRNSTPWCARLISPGRGMAAAADERDVRDRCGAARGTAARRAGRRPAGSVPATEWIALDLERLVERQRRQDPRQPPRQHRLARAGRADEQQVMSAGRGDLERAARPAPAPDVREVGMPAPVARPAGDVRGLRDARWSRLVQHTDASRKRVDGQHVAGRTNDGWLPARSAAGKQDAARAIAPRGDRNRQHAARGLDRAVERQLADQHEIVHLPAARRRPLAARTPSAIGQVERRAGLSHVGRRQVDGDAFGGNSNRVADRRPHAVAALAHARVGQAHHREHRQAERHVHFDVQRRRPRCRRRPPSAGSASTQGMRLQSAHADARCECGKSQELRAVTARAADGGVRRVSANRKARATRSWRRPASPSASLFGGMRGMARASDGEPQSPALIGCRAGGSRRQRADARLEQPARSTTACRPAYAVDDA